MHWRMMNLAPLFPAQAGIQQAFADAAVANWLPAFAGMSGLLRDSISSHPALAARRRNDR
jgi:hypothetical protein